MDYFLFLICLALPTYLIRFQIFGIPTNLLEICLYLGVLGQVVIIFKKRSFNFKPITSSNILTPTVLILLSGVISVFISPDKRTSLGILKGWFVDPILLTGLILLNIQSEKTAQKIIWGLTGSGTLVAFWGIMQKFGFGYLLPHQSLDPSFRSYLITGRSFGPFESPNYLGMYLAPVSLLLFFYWLKTKLISSPKILFQKKQLNTREVFFKWQIKDFLILFCFLVMLLALFFTQSLGAWLGFGIAMLLGIFLFFRPLLPVNPKSKLIFDIAYLICALLLILGSFVLIKNMGCRVENSFAARQEVWQVAWYLVRKYPLTGIGLGLFPLFYHQTVARLHFPPLNWFQLHPHNLFFAFWLNLGLLGLLAFLWLLLVAFRQIIKNQQLFLLAPLLAIVIHGLVDTTYWKNDLSVIFWIFLALAFIFWQDEKENSV